MKKLYLSLYNLIPAKKLKHLFAFVFIAATVLPAKLLAQAPTLSYSSPYSFLLNTPGTLAPTSSNVAAPTGAYGSATLLGTGMTFQVNGVAVDAAGNMYVNDAGTGGGEFIYKIAADGSSTTSIGSGFVPQSGNVAVDGAGNVYVTDQSRVWKIPASGSPVTYGTPVVINSSLTQPFGIACDAAGNLYVTNLAGGVYKMASDGSNAVRIDTGIGEPASVAIDAAGNVYATDFSTLALYEIPANGGPQTQLATGFSFPRGLAVDAAGTIYVDDEGKSGIFTVQPGGGTPVALVAGLSNLVGLAVDASYNLYGVLQGTGGVSKFSPTGGYFINPVTLPAGLSFDQTTGIISGTPTASSRPVNYLVSAYNGNGGASATVNIAADAVIFSYSTPQTYTAGTAITALDPSITAGTVGSPGYSATSVSVGSGFSNPAAVAVDAAGNVYAADAGNGAVKKIPAGGGSSVSIGSGFSYPTGVAVDAAGDVFVADPSSDLVAEIPAGGGAQVTLGSGFTAPFAVAVDQSGNVYVIDEGTNTLYKIPAGNGTPVVLGAGFIELTALTVDQSGNLYVVDGGASTVYEVPEKGGILVSVGGSFLFPTGVAVDASGIVYVADYDRDKIYQLSGCGCTEVSIGSHFSQPGGLAVDGAGNVYVASTGSSKIKEISPVGGYFINTPLPKGLRMNDTTGVISGKPKTVSSAASYTITAWNAAGFGSAPLSITVVAPPAPAISYATPPTYTAGTAITPLSPSNSGGTVAFPAYNDTPVSIGSGFSSPFGVITDAAGDIYIADAGSGIIKEIPFGSTTPVPVASGFDYPTAIALDAAGDLYIADQGAHAVYEIPFGGSQQTIASLDAPDGIAVDAAGNVFVSDETSNTVYKLGSGSPTVIESGFSDLTNITLDSSNNLYILDGGGSTLYEVPETGGIPIPIGDFFLYPTAVTVDAQGNIFVADGDAGTIFKLPIGTLGQFAIANGFNEPGGVAVDGAGNVYVGDTNNNAVDEINPAGGYFLNTPLPQGLSLDSKTGAISGTATGASPAKNYTITAYNTGGNSAAMVSIAVTLPPPPVIAYTTPQLFTEGVAITPVAPTSNNVDLPSYSSTFGTVGTGFNLPHDVAIDNKGNIYIADAGNQKVWELPAGGGPQVSIGSGFVGPVGVAVDTLGNVYVADGSAPAVIKIPAGGGPQVSLGSGYNYPDAVAVDGHGVVYIADGGTNVVYKMGPNFTNKTPFVSGFSYLVGVAVDNLGNVYVADEGSGAPSALYEIAAGTTTKTLVSNNFDLLTGVATDASGNVFAVDGGLGTITEFPSGGGSPVTISGANLPFGAAADGAGNLYVADIGTNQVDKFTPTGGYYVSAALPAGLSFASTTGIISGTPTTPAPAKNYTVSAYNVGAGTAVAVSIKVLSTDANLSNLTISRGGLTPAFATGVTSYSSSVLNGVTSLTITPTSSDPNAAILVDTTHTVVSGSPSEAIPLSVGPNSVTIYVTSQDGHTTKNYDITVTRARSSVATLSNLQLSAGALSPGFAILNTSYTANVVNGVSAIIVTPTATDPTATVLVGISDIVTSGTPSDPIPLSVGSNNIRITVTAQDGSTQKIYTITVTRAASPIDNLSALTISRGTLSPFFATKVFSYTASVANGVTSMTVTPTATDPGATNTVNTTDVVISGNASAPINLAVGSNTITVLVTAADRVSTKTYTITVTRAASPNASLSALRIDRGALSPSFGNTITSYAAGVQNGVLSMRVTPTAAEPGAAIVVNTTDAVASGTASDLITLAVGSNTISITVTAPDGVTTKTYTVTVTRATSSIDAFQPVGVEKPESVATLAEDSIMVHQGVSPNGDGINDYLVIDNISQYPDNKLAIMNRNGQLVFEAKGYDNTSKIFDGHSNKDGQLQLPGTYFYSLDYTVNGVAKHKTGFIVLKY